MPFLIHSTMCVNSSPKQDQATTCTLKLIDNQNNLTTLVPSKDDTSIKVIKNGVVTSNVEPIENLDPCLDQNIPSSCSTIPCSLLLSTLPKYFQALENPIK